MSITLDPTLKTAQDGVSHRPIFKLTSSPMGEIIPTSGNYFNTLSTTEEEPHITLLSSGRLAVILERANALKYLYTPTDRSEFTEVSISIPSTHNASGACLCELTDGNVGIIFATNNRYLYYKIITPTGTTVTEYTQIYDAGSGAWVANPYVITLANNTYLLVYPEGTGTPPSESNTYYLQQRTSSNFTSWSAATNITPGAFASLRYCNNPHLLQIASGRIILHVDYLSQYINNVELNNVFYMTSDDNGSSWSGATNVTNITEIGESAIHPTAAEKENGDVTFMYAFKSVVKMLDENMDGYPYGEIKTGGFIEFDPDTRKIIWHHGIHSVGLPHVGMTTINVDGWEWNETLTEQTIPALWSQGYDIYGESHCEWTVARLSYGNPAGIHAINHNTNEIKLYMFGQYAGNGVTYAFNYACGYANQNQKCFMAVEHDGLQKLFILHQCSGYGSYDANLGWIDLNQVADPISGLYDYTELWRDAGSSSISTAMVGTVLGAGSSRWDYVHDYFCTHTWNYRHTNPGLVCWNTNGTIVLELSRATLTEFPRCGVRSFMFVENDVYFSFPYWEDEPDRRGLGHYQASTGTVIFHQPTWATVNDFEFDHFVDMGDGRILMTSNNTLANGGGIAIFDTTTGSWQIINDDTYPGFGRTGAYWSSLAYDPVTKTIFAIYNDQLIAFSEYGPYSSLMSTDITSVNSTFDYGDYYTFTANFFEYQSNIVYDPDGVLWAVWQHLEAGTEYSAKWVNLLDDLEITDDVSINTNIEIKWDIEKPTQLKFGLARGHLFDPQNFMSTLSPFMRKGRKIVVEFGEKVSDTDYYQPQGEFCIKKTAMSYSTRDYPELKVTGEDFRVLWEDNEVVATMYYENQTPYNTLYHILTNHGDMEDTELDIPSPFENAHNLHAQWVDMTLEDIVKEILDHFGYFPFVNVSGDFEPRYIDMDKATDHAYTNVTQLTEYSPNDSYSTFINRVIVKGISHVYTEVLYGEECVTSLNGTTGFWGKENDEVVWYSNDHQDSCRYPRLEIIESVANAGIFGIQMGGGHESITDVDEDEHYVIVTIVAPDLTGLFILTCSSLVTLGVAALMCDGAFTGNCGWYIMGCMMLVNVIVYILGAVASYNYNIWARPIGHEKSTFQANADDEDFQREIGNKIIPTTIDDPMAYTIAICQSVADHELSIVMAQRRRLKFKKTAHLMDEIGDVLELIHPYSGEVLKVFVPTMTRKMTIGKEFIDEIEGWRIM